MSLFTFFWDKIVKPKDMARIQTLRVPSVYENNDIAYLDSNDVYHKLDVYSLEENSTQPTVIDVHGGGWYYGDKELNKVYCLNLAERGFKVVNVSYRLAPSVTLFDQVNDVANAINYVCDNADALGVDLNNLFITGDSAGGHLTSLMINLSHDEEMQKAFGIKLKATFNAVCYTCPALYVTSLATTPIVKSYFNPILGKNAKKNPIFPFADFRIDYAGDVPALFITCDGDFMKGQTVKGYNEYVASGRVAELVDFTKDKQTNKLEHVFNVIQPDWEEGKKTNDTTAEFFKKYVK